LINLKKSVFAQACANIALIKYWGKRKAALNLPAVGSISLTLEALKTHTRVDFDTHLLHDILKINDQPASPEQQKRVSEFMDIVRSKAAIDQHARIDSHNNFPTAAGLASSASAFAALSVAASRAAGLTLSSEDLSRLARQGSGSAARSIYGGFVEMIRGIRNDGTDACARQIKPPDYWDLRVLIVVTSRQEKQTGSSAAMKRSAQTSPFYSQWIEHSENDLAEMRMAIADKNFEKLGELSEFNALKMHALMISSRPAVIYWNARTMDLIHFVSDLRRQAIPVYFTIDAGPQVKLISLPAYTKVLIEKLRDIPGLEDVIESSLGGDAMIEEREG